MSNKGSIAIVGALYGNNFGDALLAGLFVKSLRRNGLSVFSPHIHADTSRAAYLPQGGWADFLKADHLLFTGGGYFSEPPGHIHRWALSKYRHIFGWGDLCRLLGKPYSIIGVGAGPCESPLTRFFVRRLCKGAVAVVVRDEVSKDALVEIGVSRPISVAADYALTIEAEMDERAGNTGNVGVHLSGKVPALIEVALRAAEDRFSQLRTWYVEDHAGEFEHIALRYPRVRDYFQDRIIRYAGCDEFVAKLARMDFIITSKLHVGIVAASLGKRVCSVPFHAKVQRFYQELGRPELCYVGDLGDAERLTRHIHICFESDPVVVPEDVRNRARSIDLLISDLAAGISRAG